MSAMSWMKVPSLTKKFFEWTTLIHLSSLSRWEKTLNRLFWPARLNITLNNGSFSMGTRRSCLNDLGPLSAHFFERFLLIARVEIDGPAPFFDHGGIKS